MLKLPAKDGCKVHSTALYAKRKSEPKTTCKYYKYEFVLLLDFPDIFCLGLKHTTT